MLVCVCHHANLILCVNIDILILWGWPCDRLYLGEQSFSLRGNKEMIKWNGK